MHEVRVAGLQLCSTMKVLITHVQDSGWAVKTSQTRNGTALGVGYVAGCESAVLGGLVAGAASVG
jgi:hypothetical protein